MSYIRLVAYGFEIFSRAVLTGLLASVLVSAATVKMKRRDNQIDVIIDDQPFTTYYFERQTEKPYLMPLRTASGIVISRGFPVGNNISPADVKSLSFEPHQRPLYFAHGNIDGLDFWAEQAFSKYYHEHGPHPYGRMIFIKMEHLADNGAVGSLRARFKLVAPGGRPIAEETQAFEFRGDDRMRMIDCEFIIYAKEGPVVFGDTKEGTFAIRLGPELSAPNDHIINSTGAKGELAIWGKPADWVAYTGTVFGEPVTVVTFDSPKNFRHPTTWHARAYGLLAANPFGLREFTKDEKRDGSWTVLQGKSLAFRYRVLIYDGELSPGQLADLYQQYEKDERSGQ
jgi:hypothetical protein